MGWIRFSSYKKTVSRQISHQISGTSKGEKANQFATLQGYLKSVIRISTTDTWSVIQASLVGRGPLPGYVAKSNFSLNGTHNNRNPIQMPIGVTIKVFKSEFYLFSNGIQSFNFQVVQFCFSIWTILQWIPNSRSNCLSKCNLIIIHSVLQLLIYLHLLAPSSI